MSFTSMIREIVPRPTFYSLLGVSCPNPLNLNPNHKPKKLSTPFWEFLAIAKQMLESYDFELTIFLLPFGSFLSLLNTTVTAL